ncbi:MAG: formate dehydrogenase accessory sulfurtransferase FdhD [Planctomycetes bacterium]|nr:formate dehydrogenase accessory sulfurtransferase FdhD [Planctomycetota bacterium]
MDVTTERIRTCDVTRRGAAAGDAVDSVVVEEPLEIRVMGRPVAVVMRTPGDDRELAAGFVITEGIIELDDLSAVSNCYDANGETAKNVINVSLVEGAKLDYERFRRNMYTTSSCGICGKATLDAVEVQAPPVSSDIRVDEIILYQIAATCRKSQRLFDETGGLHAAALFDPSGKLIDLREDVGRHNAVDKVVGARILGGAPTPIDAILFVSGRAAFEILQKARVAGIAIVAAVGAPTSLAIDCAKRGEITLVGFLRDGGMNIYNRPDRIRARG